MSSSFPPQALGFRVEQPDPTRPDDLARAITRISKYPVWRFALFARTITAATTLNPYTDSVLLVDASGGAVTVTLPPAAGADARPYYIKKIDSSANAVTIDGDGAETIDGAATQSTITQYQVYCVLSDGSAWYLL